MTDERTSKLSEVITFGMADLEVSAHFEERLASFDTIPVIEFRMSIMYKGWIRTHN